MFTNIKLLGLEVDKGPTLPKKFSRFAHVTAPLHTLFIMIKIQIFRNEQHNFYAFWNLNTTARSKKLSVEYKQTTP